MLSSPNWPDLFDEIPPAIEQLESHDAHCSLEAATLLQGALDTLRAPNGVRAWDEIVNAIGRLAELGFRHVDKLPREGELVRNNLPPDTITFICTVAGAYQEWGAPRETDDVVTELCAERDKRLGRRA